MLGDNATRRVEGSPQQFASCDKVNFEKIIVAAADFCRCDQLHEFKPVCDKVSESRVVPQCMCTLRQQVAATNYI